jgi:hypothetical protein
MNNNYTKQGAITAAIITAATLASAMVLLSSTTLQVYSIGSQSTGAGAGRAQAAPIATSGDNNVYVSWWSNKTGNDEVMFKASTDGGKTFSNKMNLSSTPKSDSQDAQIAAAGNNVYITWWERNQTMNEPVMKVSNDNGKTFGEKIMLSNNATTAKQ